MAYSTHNLFLSSLVVLCVVSVVSCHYKNPLGSLTMHNTKIKHDSQIQIQALPATLQKSGDWITVSWSGVSNPSNDDWLAVYSPSNVDPMTTSPVKFEYANASMSYQESGSGSLRFQLVNMYADYQIVFFRNGTNFPILAASSNNVVFKNLKVPLQGHLALTSDLSEMRLSWASPDPSGSQEVKWGTESSVYTFSAKATTTTYTKDDLCGDPANAFGWRDPHYLHTVIMNNLTPSQKYYYVYGSDLTTGWSTEASFISAPVTSASTGVTLITYGDMGKGNADGSTEHWDFETASLNTTKNVIEQLDEIDLVVHIGDISYAVGYSAQWDEFMSQVEPIATRVAYMTCIGNHERDFPNSGGLFNGTDSGGECGVPYEHRFIMPDPAQDQPWYSFNYGNIHFTLMSTEHDFSQGSVQYNWIEADLASVNRTATPFLIFAGHRPMYIDSTKVLPPDGDQPVAKMLRDSIEDLLITYRVNLALWGHHHSYQRTCNVYKEVCYNVDSGYPIHAVIGNAGFLLTQNLEKVTPPWIVTTDIYHWGFSKIQTTETSLHFQYYQNDNPITPADEFFINV